MAGWAGKPLEFEPGNKWQYPATRIMYGQHDCGETRGMPCSISRKTLFGPLQIKSVFNSDAAPLPAGAPKRYHRSGSAHPSGAKGRHGIVVAAGELAMTATDLARWDIR